MNTAPLHYFTGVLIVCIAGSLGGLIAAVGALVEEGKNTEGSEFIATKGVPVWLFLVGRCVVGIGGAAAILGSVTRCVAGGYE
jgi:hypothetical protein